MSIYNEYLTGIDREIAIEEAAFELEFSKLFTMLEMCDIKLEQMEKDAELKVLTECGTYDDLAYLIEEANNEVAPERKGIITRIVEAILSIFKAIGDGFKKIFNIGNANQEVEAPADTVEKSNMIIKCINGIDSGMTKLSNGERLEGVKEILKSITIPSIVVAGGTAGIVGAVKVFKKIELDNIMKKVHSAQSKLEARFEGLKGKLSSLGDTFILKKIKEIASTVKSFISNIISCIFKTNKNENPNEQPEKKDRSDEKYRSFNQGGHRYRLFEDGTWEREYKTKDENTGKEVVEWKPITPNNHLKKLADKGVTQESTIEEIQAILGDSVIVECVGDEIIIKENENYMESPSVSIFGHNTDEVIVTESSDELDKDYDDIASILEDL